MLENDRGFFSAFGQLDSEKIAMLEAALGETAENSTGRAMILATYCQELTFATPLERRLQLAEEAISAARAAGDPTTVVRVLNRVDGPLRAPRELARSLARSAEAQERADSIGDPVLRFWAATARRVAAAQARDLSEVDRCLRTTEELAQAVGQPTMSWVDTYARATRVLLAGELELAEQMANWAFEIAQEGDEPDAFPVLAAHSCRSARSGEPWGRWCPSSNKLSMKIRDSRSSGRCWPPPTSKLTIHTSHAPFLRRRPGRASLCR